MRYLLDLSLYQIQVFIKAAEFKNFTATASFFNTTQSSVSKSIASMESILGFPLFTRNRNRLELTVPGQYLYDHWYGWLPHAESSVATASLLYEHHLQTLIIGVPDSLANGSQIEYINQFKTLYPDVRLVYHVIPSNQLVPRLETGELDVIITGLFEQNALQRLGAQWKLYLYMPESVLMHRLNPLAQKPQITMNDLRDEEFIMLSPSEHASYFDRVCQLCARYDFQPNIELLLPNFRSMITNLLDYKRGVIIANPLITHANHPDLCHFEIQGTNAGMIIAWKKKNANKYVPKFVDLFPAVSSL